MGSRAGDRLYRTTQTNAVEFSDDASLRFLTDAGLDLASLSRPVELRAGRRSASLKRKR